MRSAKLILFMYTGRTSRCSLSPINTGKWKTIISFMKHVHKGMKPISFDVTYVDSIEDTQR